MIPRPIFPDEVYVLDGHEPVISEGQGPDENLEAEKVGDVPWKRVEGISVV